MAATMRAATKSPPQRKRRLATTTMRETNRRRKGKRGSHCQRLNRHRDECACPAPEDTALRGEPIGYSLSIPGTMFHAVLFAPLTTAAATNTIHNSPTTAK